MKKWLLLSIAFFSPEILANMDYLSLQPVLTDVSVGYLSNAFGAIGGVLQGGGSQILGQMFRVMNTLLLCFAGILWSYTSCIGILNTASEGQFLGQKWSSMWVPVRIVGGTCLLIPKAATGYSIVQVIVMYVVIQGIGLANHVWGTAINYLDNFGTIVETRLLNRHALKQEADLLKQQADYTLLIQQAGDILKAEVSMILAQNAQILEDQEKGTMQRHVYSIPELHVQLLPDGKVIQFTNMHATRFKQDNVANSCGYVSWKNTLDPTFDAFVTAGIQQMVWQLLPLAQQIAQTTLTTSSKKTSTIPSVELSSLPYGALYNSVLSFLSITKPALLKKQFQENEKTNQEFKKNFQKMKAEGWMMAGSYYYQLAKYNQKIRNLNQKIDLSHRYMKTRCFLLEIEKQFKNKKIKEQWHTIIQKIDSAIEREQVDTEYMYHEKLFPKGEEGKSFVSPHENRQDILNQLFSPFHKNIQFFQRNMEATLQSHIDPVIALATIGSLLIYAVEEAWKGLVQNFITFSGIFFKTTEKGGEAWHIEDSSNRNSLLATIGTYTVFTPLIIIWTVSNFIIGATLIYYVPLVPFLIFFFGALTWFIFIFEAMIAGALIALGLMHPEGGHDFFGKAEQSTMLLASLFFRPVLMIFGFISGIILCSVAFNFFNYSYDIAIQSVHQLEAGSDWLNIVTHTAMIMIYTTIAIAIVNRSFSLVYEIPNRALRWMSGPTDNHNEAEVPLQVKGSIERYASDAGGRVITGMSTATDQQTNNTVRVDYH